METILLVEDDPMMNAVNKTFLEQADFQVLSAQTGEEALVLFNSDISLVLLDIMLPQKDGLAVAKEIRSQSTVPIMMVTAIEDEMTQLLSYQQLVDDYITKPISPMVLTERVKAVLRRCQMSEDTKQLTIQNITVDFDRLLVSRGNERIRLTKKEFDILAAMFQHVNRVTTREFLVDHVWGYEYDPSDRVIDTHLKNIRKKIPELEIETIKGLGYLLEDHTR